MTEIAQQPPATARPGLLALGAAGRRFAGEAAVPALALLAAAALFSVFLLLQGRSPAEFFALLVDGAFGSAFSFENTLVRAAPLLLTALCVALPARLGLVIIGGEGALVLGGVAAAAAAIPASSLPAPLLLLVMA